MGAQRRSAPSDWNMSASGQPLTTLSGGESQRLKLAAHMAKARKAGTLVYFRRADHRPAFSRYRAAALGV